MYGKSNLYNIQAQKPQSHTAYPAYQADRE